MTELIHSVTGEVLDYVPANPVEVEYIIRELADRLERAVPILDDLQKKRYEAETAYSAAFETAKLTSKAEMYSDRRSEAKIACLGLERELNEIKAQLHHAERLQDALKAKLSGYQTISKSVQSAYGSYR
jgi:hypothetical protein